MSKVAAQEKKGASRRSTGIEGRSVEPLAPPERHVVQGASASEILNFYGITQKEVESARRRLRKLGLL
jgi:hypothetical protein